MKRIGWYDARGHYHVEHASNETLVRTCSRVAQDGGKIHTVASVEGPR